MATNRCQFVAKISFERGAKKLIIEKSSSSTYATTDKRVLQLYIRIHHISHRGRCLWRRRAHDRLSQTFRHHIQSNRIVWLAMNYVGIFYSWNSNTYYSVIASASVHVGCLKRLPATLYMPKTVTLYAHPEPHTCMDVFRRRDKHVSGYIFPYVFIYLPHCFG
jgi:hypothetical protein